MEQQPIIIAKNVSGSSQGFLGSVIQAGAESQISDLYFQNEITGSSELRVLINSGDIVINNGADDLSIAPAIALCSYPYSMLNATTSGTDNASVGTSTLESITTGDSNTAVGDNALSSLTTGSDNIAVGVQSGINYTGNESNNILLGNPGIVTETDTIRIGTTNQTSAHIAGIHAVTPTLSTEIVIIDPNGELGSVTGANIAQYRQNNNLNISTSATTVALNATDFQDSNFSRSGENITINADGVYRISYNVYFATNANGRRTVDAWVENNTTEIVPSRAASYCRNNTDDTASSGAAFLVGLAATNIVRLRCQSTGTGGTPLGQGNRMWITLEFVKPP